VFLCFAEHRGAEGEKEGPSFAIQQTKESTMYSMSENSHVWSKIHSGQQQYGLEEKDKRAADSYVDHSDDTTTTTGGHGTMMSPQELSMLFSPKGWNELVCQWNGRPNGPPPFPVTLYSMLDAIQKDPTLTSIVSWQPHGRCFVVHKVQQFVYAILPR
jgi:HSF-type DNA-binding